MITLTREEAQQVLDALEPIALYKAYNGDDWPARQVMPAIKTLRARLSEHEQTIQQFAEKLAAAQEPLGYDAAKVLYDNLPELYAKSETKKEGCSDCGIVGIHACLGKRNKEQEPCAFIAYNKYEGHYLTSKGKGKPVYSAPLPDGYTDDAVMQMTQLIDELDAKLSQYETQELLHKEQEPVAWKPVVGYENEYEISSAGDLRYVKTSKIKSKPLMGAGYEKADLWKNGVRQQTSVHRLVAEAFLEKPNGATEVNHKNGIKTDNRVENLEWVSRSENVNHSYYELGNNVKPIIAKNIETGEEKEYPSVEAAVRDGFHSAHISSVLAGRRKQHKGHTFSEAAPPQREWQGLTDEEIRNEAKNHVFDESFFSGAIWARGKMMGKNYD